MYLEWYKLYRVWQDTNFHSLGRRCFFFKDLHKRAAKTFTGCVLSGKRNDKNKNKQRKLTTEFLLLTLSSCCFFSFLQTFGLSYSMFPTLYVRFPPPISRALLLPRFPTFSKPKQHQLQTKRFKLLTLSTFLFVTLLSRQYSERFRSDPLAGTLFHVTWEWQKLPGSVKR